MKHLYALLLSLVLFSSVLQGAEPPPSTPPPLLTLTPSEHVAYLLTILNNRESEIEALTFTLQAIQREAQSYVTLLSACQSKLGYSGPEGSGTLLESSARKVDEWVIDHAPEGCTNPSLSKESGQWTCSAN